MSSSSSGSLSLTSPGSTGTTQCMVVVQQEPSQIEPQLGVDTRYSRDCIRRQICVVVRNLEAVVTELNSVMNELQGVLEQIDRVTGCLDSRIASQSLFFHHSTDEETRIPGKRHFVSSRSSLSSDLSKKSSSSTSSSSTSTDLSSLWKLPRKASSRSSSGKRSNRSHRKSREVSSNAPSQGTRLHKSNSNNKDIERQKRFSAKIEHVTNQDDAKEKDKVPEESSRVRLRNKKRNHKRAFFHGICCVRTHSMYSADSDPRRSCISDDNTWVLRSGNGVESPMYPGNLLPLPLENKTTQRTDMARSLSEGNISSCSSNKTGRRSQHSKASVNLPNGQVPNFKQDPAKINGIVSLSDNSLRTNSSNDFIRRTSNPNSLLMRLDSDKSTPLMTYLKSPVSSARMHRDSEVFEESNGILGNYPRKHSFPGSVSRKMLVTNGIYQYESETEISQRDMTQSDGCGGTPDSDPSVTISIGPTLSEIEPDMVETDFEVEFSLMSTLPTDAKKVDNNPEVVESDKNSPSENSDKMFSLQDSLTSLEKREKLERSLRLYSYDSEADNCRGSEKELNKLRERELAAEGLKLLLYGENSKSSDDISEQKEKIMAELDNLKLSFSTRLSTPESENGKLLRQSLTQFDDFSPDSQPQDLSEALTLKSTGSNGESPLSNGFETDPEVKAFLQELDKKIKEDRSKSGSIDNMSVFTGSKESLAFSDTILSNKLSEAVLDVNSNIKMNSIFKSSMDSILTEDSNRRCSSDPGDSDNLMESFEWEHSFTFSMYQESGSKIPDLSPDDVTVDDTLDSSFSPNFELDEALTYSLSYPLEKAKSRSLSSESFIWSEGSITSDRRLDSTGKSVEELLSELDISTDLLSKSALKRPETLVPSLDQKTVESLSRSEGNSSDYKVSYNRDINTWTAFTMVHIGGSDSNLSRSSAVSEVASHTSNKSTNHLQSSTSQDVVSNTAPNVEKKGLTDHHQLNTAGQLLVRYQVQHRKPNCIISRLENVTVL